VEIFLFLKSPSTALRVTKNETNSGKKNQKKPLIAERF